MRRGNPWMSVRAKHPKSPLLDLPPLRERLDGQGDNEREQRRVGETEQGGDEVGQMYSFTFRVSIVAFTLGSATVPIEVLTATAASGGAFSTPLTTAVRASRFF